MGSIATFSPFGAHAETAYSRATQFQDCGDGRPRRIPAPRDPPRHDAARATNRRNHVARSIDRGGHPRPLGQLAPRRLPRGQDDQWSAPASSRQLHHGSSRSPPRMATDELGTIPARSSAWRQQASGSENTALRRKVRRQHVHLPFGHDRNRRTRHRGTPDRMVFARIRHAIRHAAQKPQAIVVMRIPGETRKTLPPTLSTMQVHYQCHRRRGRVLAPKHVPVRIRAAPSPGPAPASSRPSAKACP